MHRVDRGNQSYEYIDFMHGALKEKNIFTSAKVGNEPGNIAWHGTCMYP